MLKGRYTARSYHFYLTSGCNEKLISKIGGKFSLAGVTCLFLFGNVCRLIAQTPADLKHYLDLNHSPQAPEGTWCVLVRAFDEFMSIVNVCFKLMQYSDTLLTEPNTRMQNCVTNLIELIATSKFGTSEFEVYYSLSLRLP